MMKKIAMISSCILISCVNSQEAFSSQIISALYENQGSIPPPPPYQYNSAWTSFSTDTHTYIAGPSSDLPNSSWAAKKMFIAKYDNATMGLVASNTFTINGSGRIYPYFIKEISGYLYIGGGYYANNRGPYGFVGRLDKSSLSIEILLGKEGACINDLTSDGVDFYLVGQKWNQKNDVFLKKCDKDMNPISSDIVIVGNENDYGLDVKYNQLDGKVYIAGYTTNGFSSYPKSFLGDSYFVARCDDALSAIESLVYVGGSGNEFYNQINTVIDGNNLYIAGGTESNDMPPHASSKPINGGADAFVSMIDISPGTPLVIKKTLYLGGSGSEICRLDETTSGSNQSSYLYCQGVTTSTDFKEVPVSALQKNNAGGKDLFFAKIFPALSKAVATYIGGTGDDISYSPSSYVKLGEKYPYLFSAGFTGSDVFPSGLTKKVAQAAFLTRIDNIFSMLGDANGDQCVNGLDYSILERYLKENFELEDWQIFALDIDQDGNLDQYDLNILQKIMPGPDDNNNDKCLKPNAQKAPAFLKN